MRRRSRASDGAGPLETVEPLRIVDQDPAQRGFLRHTIAQQLQQRRLIDRTVARRRRGVSPGAGIMDQVGPIRCPKQLMSVCGDQRAHERRGRAEVAIAFGHDVGTGKLHPAAIGSQQVEEGDEVRVADALRFAHTPAIWSSTTGTCSRRMTGAIGAMIPGSA